MSVGVAVFLGILIWALVRSLRGSVFVVNQNERAVKTVFGKAQRISGKTTLDDPIADCLSEDEKLRYHYPQLRIIKPGGPYLKFPWETVHKVSIAIETENMACDPGAPANSRKSEVLDAVTKDQLDIVLSGQIRYRISEKNLYAYIFGVKNPIAHVFGYFVSVLRERIANFEGTDKLEPLLHAGASQETEQGSEIKTYSAFDSSANLDVEGISINDLRKNLRDLNEHMDEECRVSEARYGVVLEASLITGIDPPDDVESALAAINTAHNQVSSDISLAQAAADQKIVQSKRAVEIETLKAQGEIETLKRISEELSALKKSGGKKALALYVRNVKLALMDQTKRIVRKEEKV